MSDGTDPPGTPDRETLHVRELLLRVRDVDPAAAEDPVRRYAREIAEAEAVLRSLDVDPSSHPLDVSFSPVWNVGRTP